LRERRVNANVILRLQTVKCWETSHRVLYSQDLYICRDGCVLTCLWANEWV